MLMNDKIMFDRYYCINSAKHCKNEENIGALYFIYAFVFVNTWQLIACSTGIYAIIYVHKSKVVGTH